METLWLAHWKKCVSQVQRISFGNRCWLKGALWKWSLSFKFSVIKINHRGRPLWVTFTGSRRIRLSLKRTWNPQKTRKFYIFEIKYNYWDHIKPWDVVESLLCAGFWTQNWASTMGRKDLFILQRQMGTVLHKLTALVKVHNIHRLCKELEREQSLGVRQERRSHLSKTSS